MIQVKFSSKGLECNQHISVGTFAPNGNAIVRAVCEKKCYQEERAFEDSICSLLSRMLPDGYKVTTHHVALNSSTGTDMSGKFRGCLKTIVNGREFSESDNDSCNHEHFVG